MYLLDTDHCSAILKGDRRIISKLNSFSENAVITTTSISLAELYFGAFLSSKTNRWLEHIQSFSLGMKILDFDEPPSRIFGQLKAALKRKGELIEDIDLFIASIALHHNMTLVTHNTRHYNRVPQLVIEDWLA